jgi:hypothetical protein
MLAKGLHTQMLSYLGNRQILSLNQMNQAVYSSNQKNQWFHSMMQTKVRHTTIYYKIYISKIIAHESGESYKIFKYAGKSIS